MPRGGRRSGSGAPRGNTNALRRGGRSRRMRETWRGVQILVALSDEHGLRAIIAAIRDAGLVGPGGKTRANVGKIVRLIHPMLVDSSSTTVNQTNQKTAGPAPEKRAGPAVLESEPPAGPPVTPADQPDRKKTTDNQNPEVS